MLFQPAIDVSLCPLSVCAACSPRLRVRSWRALQAAAGDAARAQPRVVSLHQPIPSRASKIQEAAGQEKRRSLNAQEQLRASAPPAFQSLMQVRGPRREWGYFDSTRTLVSTLSSTSVLVHALSQSAESFVVWWCGGRPRHLLLCFVFPDFSHRPPCAQSPTPPVTVLGKSAGTRRTPEMRASLTSSNMPWVNK
jgi:hypothetical protein